MLLPTSNLRIPLFKPWPVNAVKHGKWRTEKTAMKLANGLIHCNASKTKESACRGENFSLPTAVLVIANIIFGPTAIHGPPTAEHLRIDCFRECKLITQVHKI